MQDNNSLDNFLENDPEMVQCFIDESQSCLNTALNNLSVLEGKDADEELLEEAFRSVHSIKSSAGFLGLNKVVELALILENILNRMRKGSLAPEGEVVEKVVTGLNVMKDILDDVKKIDDIDTLKLCEDLKKFTD